RQGVACGFAGGRSDAIRRPAPASAHTPGLVGAPERSPSRAVRTGAAMKLEGSCHCGAVRFQLESAHRYPFMRCYCSICRKTAGAGGYAINLGGDYRTLKIKGKKHIAVYRAWLVDEQTGKRTRSSGRRHFCKRCGSPLWLWDPTWADLVHPHASA